MVDVDSIHSELVKFTRSIVGNRLSTLPKTNIPAVIKSRENGYKPDLPYIVIDKGSLILPNHFVLNKYMDENCDIYYEVLYKITFDWKCYGENSNAILSELQSMWSVERVRDKLYSDVSAMTIIDKGSVFNTPDLLSTKFEEGARVTNGFYVIDCFKDPLQEDQFIEAIRDINGTLITGVNGDIDVVVFESLDFSDTTPTFDSNVFTFDQTFK